MITPLHRFPDVTTTDLRALKRLASHLVEAPDLNTLGRQLMDSSLKILPADFSVWNLWTPTMDKLLSFELNHQHFQETVDQLVDPLHAAIQYHPIIAAGAWDNIRLKPLRMSDYESDATFRKTNPLFQEVYRHIESYYQINYSPIVLGQVQIILTWTLRSRDFTEREIQLLHLLGAQIAVLASRIEDRRHLHEMWSVLNERLGTVLEPLSADRHLLSAKDGTIISALIQGTPRADIAASLNWRRDTLDCHLGELRERLGYENTSQLLRALAELKTESTGLLVRDGTATSQRH